MSELIDKLDCMWCMRVGSNYATSKSVAKNILGPKKITSLDFLIALDR